MTTMRMKTLTMMMIKESLMLTGYQCHSKIAEMRMLFDNGDNFGNDDDNDNNNDGNTDDDN